MIFRPRQVHWFETYTPRNLTVYAIDSLAETGHVEFYHQNWSKDALDAEFIISNLKQFTDLAKQFESDLPGSLSPPETHAEPPENLAEEIVKKLRTWGAELLWLKRKISRVADEIERLEIVKNLLEAVPDHDLDFGWIEQSSEVLYKKLFSCPPGVFDHPSGENIALRIFPALSQDYILALGTPDHLEIVEATSTLMGCKEIKIPADLSSLSSRNNGEIVQRINRLKSDLNELEARLIEHKQNETIKTAQSNYRILKLFIENPHSHIDGDKRCHLCGWTSVESSKELEHALHKAGIDTQIVFSEKPVQNPPVQLTQARWVRPFTVFIDFAGTPGKDEIDPTPLLVVVVPTLFGYMFPDVGHGLVLIIAGFLLRKKIKQAVILVPCGAAASIFGFIFGDVFGRHDLIDALWLKPLEDPLFTIFVPLVFGAMLITIGLLFSAIEAHWRGQFVIWLQTDASELMLYLVLLASLFWMQALWLIVPVILWFAAGTALNCVADKPLCVIKNVARLVDGVFRLGLNTLSFVRVGAFALAHSATSHAANLIAHMIDNPVIFIIFIVFSHAFIVVLEGLIVFVQTSRLILFEFFIRFLRADGRIFRPLRGSIEK